MKGKWYRSAVFLGSSLTLALGGGISAVAWSRSTGQTIKAESINKSEGKDDEMKLKYVQIFFRHGARTPLTHLYGVEEEVYDAKVLYKKPPYTEISYVAKDITGKGERPSSHVQKGYNNITFKVTYDKRYVKARLFYTEIPYIVEDINNGGPRPYSRLWLRDRSRMFKGGVPAGMLTSLGRDQAYTLGKQLKDRYSSFIGEKFEPELVYVQSTNIDRCIESLSCVLAGLFGKSSFRDEDPVKIRVNELSNEVMIPLTFNCPAFQRLSNVSREAINSNQEFVDVVQKIKAKTGDPASIEEFDMMQIRDHIIARRSHGLAIPQFLLDLEDKISEAAVQVLVSHVCGDCVIQASQKSIRSGLSLGIGRCLNMIRENLENHTSNNSTPRRDDTGRKMALYSCHDSTVAPLLMAMGCYDNQWPPYSSDVAIELHEKKSHSNEAPSHWVRVLYCGKEMRLRGCESTTIPLEKFYSVISTYALDDGQYKSECYNNAYKAIETVQLPGRTCSGIPPAAYLMCEARLGRPRCYSPKELLKIAYNTV